MIYDLFFTNIGDFFADFRAPPLVEGCGLRFEGVGRMWESIRTLGETRDEGDPAGAPRTVLKRRHLPQILFRKCRTHVL